MGYLKIKLHPGNTNGQEQDNLRSAMKKRAARFEETKCEWFYFYDSTISVEEVTKRALAAIEEAGLEKRVRIVGEPMRIREWLLTYDGSNVTIERAGKIDGKDSKTIPFADLEDEHLTAEQQQELRRRGTLIIEGE